MKIIQQISRWFNYQKYRRAAKKYTTPLTFKAWCYDIDNLTFSC